MLFVDDEARVLEGLRRILFAQRNEWEMHFALSGTEALHIMESVPVDLVVTDMRMPEMDGARLLEIVRERHPGSVRIVLSGHSNADAALRAMTVAHMYLAKPCDTATLVTAIRRALRLRSSLSDDNLRAIVNQTGQLPSAPRVYLALIRALADAKYSSERIATLIGQDAALAAKVLQLANSSYFGRPGEAPHLAAALAILGENVLRSLVLSAETYAAFPESMREAGVSMEDEQRHGAMVARLAAGMAEGAAWAEDAFTAGLLHDVGKIVLAMRLPHAYSAVMEEAARTGRPQLQIERELLGTDHAVVGGYLFDLWGLPGRVVESVLRHHDAHEQFEGVLDAAAAVAYANTIARAPGHVLECPDPSIPEETWGSWCAMALDLAAETRVA